MNQNWLVFTPNFAPIFLYGIACTMDMLSKDTTNETCKQVIPHLQRITFPMLYHRDAVFCRPDLRSGWDPSEHISIVSGIYS